MDSYTAPLIVLALTLGLAVAAYPLCRRKGKGPLYALLCAIPFLGWFLLIQLQSMPDKPAEGGKRPGGGQT